MEKFYRLPLEDVNEEYAVITELFFNSEDHVSAGDIIYSFETTKAVIDVEAETDGFIFYVVETDQKIKVGSVICVISSNKDFDLKSIKDTDISKKPVETIDYKLTKKAKDLADRYNLNLVELDLSGVIRERDILNIVSEKAKKPIEEPEIIVKLDIADAFIEKLLKDKSLRNISSKEKIRLYKENGHSIGENVEIKDGAIFIGNSIEIGDNVTIGEKTYIEVPEIKIHENTTIGSNSSFVASKIDIGPFNRVASNVTIDISGGRYPDSNFITGRGCLIGGESYINVCRQVKLSEHVALSPRSMIFTHSFWQSVLEGYYATFGPVEFEDDSWLGAMSQILPNVTVGSGAIIVSGSVVSSNVKSETMVGGVPSSIIKENIRKKLSEKDLFVELKNVFNGFSNYLASNRFHVKKISELEVSVLIGSEIKNLVIIDPTSRIKDTDYDIILILKEDKHIIEKANVVFNIPRKSVIGSISFVEDCLINFFRRRGIMFYPTK